MSTASASVQTPKRRWAVIALALLGAGLIAAPAIFQMFDRAPKGAVMIRDFKPFMTDARMDSFKRDIAQIRAGIKETNDKVAPVLVGGGGAQAFESAYPDFAELSAQWPAIDGDMSSMLNRIQSEIPDYEAVAALPPFALFPWFFVVPGLLLVLLAAIALLSPAKWRRARWAIVVLGAGLVLAPAVFQMFDRAPKGAKMIQAFKNIETRQKVEQIQGYFGQIAAGQGALRLEVIPALNQRGISQAEVDTRFPAVATLDRQWVPILQNLTPMIGAMSDNVVNYEAVKALPQFTLFPWFFVIPGLLVIALALGAGRCMGREGNPTGGVEPSASKHAAQTEQRKEEGAFS